MLGFFVGKERREDGGWKEEFLQSKGVIVLYFNGNEDLDKVGRLRRE